MDVLDLMIRIFAVVSNIRGHIPQSDGFDSFRDDQAPVGLLGNLAMFLTTVFCVAAGLAFVTLLAIRWLG
ncbi:MULTISPECIES: hypothetical protein [Bradyrhizobium]|jgi:hypothetical protein|uniref:Uncharacterized protein n=1 Tax=Bradyrhizobium denitrificans TaxID=2734912 RepID=A0ABS5GAB1_9BRAD|nr:MULTISPECIES: hypothetical protein [Bradyrhizobium]RTL93705.1 MAG: hypothetical protein EKK32_28525 [Bradyrhizobiaceae bacterium]ABQ38712.1 hypothetical protein BBta_6825 [Bradyrhizobium sp. BTAi1]MBR1138273.1 hypothetical protein [Bradyrhizobium denitrificans]MCL8482559.1 hypothetical protein [Bradyrhizobium denitrificans]MDU0954103.1 hypothetical protein [Bradyrhizobium sp.]